MYLRETCVVDHFLFLYDDIDLSDLPLLDRLSLATVHPDQDLQLSPKLFVVRPAALPSARALLAATEAVTRRFLSRFKVRAFLCTLRPQLSTFDAAIMCSSWTETQTLNFTRSQSTNQ